MLSIQQEATLDYDANECGHRLADTFGVNHKYVKVGTNINNPVEGFYTVDAVWFYDEEKYNCILSFKIENDEVVKVSLHLMPA